MIKVLYFAGLREALGTAAEEVSPPLDLLDVGALRAHLAARGLPCPAPLADSSGRIQRPLANKPAVLRPVGDEPLPNFLYEFSLRVLWRLTAWLMGGTLKVQHFDFAFGRPDYANDYGDTFPAPLHFGLPFSAFWFDARKLARVCSRDEQALQTFVASWPAAAIMPPRTGEGVDARVHAHLLQSRPQWAGLEATAAELNMSAPTLQRKLAAAGTSFQAIKDELRRDIAVSRLGTSKVSFTELAADLGFADAAAFQRACRQWRGRGHLHGVHRRAWRLRGGNPGRAGQGARGQPGRRRLDLPATGATCGLR